MGDSANDSGATDLFDTNCATGLTTRLIALYWHLGASKVTSPAVTPDAIRPLAMAAVWGTSDGLDAEGLALFGTWWQQQVIDRTVSPLPSGETISVREAMRRTLKALSKGLPVVPG